MNVIVISVTLNRHKRVFSQSSKVKRKPVPPPRKRSNEKEDSDSGDDGLEMKYLVATVEEDEGKYYFEDHSNIAPPPPPQVLEVRYMFSFLHNICFVIAVTGINDICEDDFPDHVKVMHQDRDQKFEVEYKVSTSS